MIRRTLQDKIFDRPIVELPKTHADVKKVDFSKEERALYQILEDRFRKDLNRLVRHVDVTLCTPLISCQLLRGWDSSEKLPKCTSKASPASTMHGTPLSSS